MNTINVAYGGNVWGAEMTGNARAPMIPVPTLGIPGLALLILLMLSLGGLLARRRMSV